MQQLPNVFLYNVDHLEALVRENVKNREQELAACQTIIAERTAALMERIGAVPRNQPAPVSEPRPAWVLGGAAALPN